MMAVLTGYLLHWERVKQVSRTLIFIGDVCKYRILPNKSLGHLTKDCKITKLY